MGVTGTDIQGIMPLIIAAGFGLIILLLDAFQNRGSSRSYLGYFAILGLVLTAVSAYVLWHERPNYVLFNGMTYLDGFGQAFTAIFAASGILTVLLSMDYLRENDFDKGEFYVLLLFAVAGMIMVATSANLMTIFLGLETMSLSIYVMTGFFRHVKRSAEASLKYLILGAVSTGILLFGISLVYGATGSLDLYRIAYFFSGDPLFEVSGQLATLLSPGDFTRIVAGEELHYLVNPVGELSAVPFFGLLLIVVALSFKIAAVPFHMWAPDVYTGAPTPVVGFMATAVKAAGFAAVLRVLLTAFFDDPARNGLTGWTQIFVMLALASMLLGNLGAIVQNRLKRMLAYSSIAHAGYIMVAVTASGYGATQMLAAPVVFYLVAYTFSTIGAFGVLTLLSRKGETVETYEDLNGLGFKYPWLGFSMGVFMFSAAGIPPTAGFVAKFLAFKAAIDSTALNSGAPEVMIGMVIVGILVSVAGVYYYLRVLVHLYFKSADERRVFRPMVSRSGVFAVGICVAMTLGLGVLPGHLHNLSNMAVGQMSDTVVWGEPVLASPPPNFESSLTLDDVVPNVEE